MVHSPVWILLCLSTFIAGIGFFSSVGLCVLCQALPCKHLVGSRVTSSSQTKKGRTESWVKIKPTELKYCIWCWLEPKSSYLLLNAVTKVTKQDINSGCPEKSQSYWGTISTPSIKQFIRIVVLSGSLKMLQVYLLFIWIMLPNAIKSSHPNIQVYFWWYSW